LEEYSNEAHLFAVKAAIQYSEKIHDTDDFPLTLKAKMMIVFPVFRTLQRTPSSQKKFLEHFLTVQLSTGHLKFATTLNFVFVHVQFHPNHRGKKIIS
jgi:hypothetical protein